MGRTIVIGDVHGCLVELKALIEKVGFKKGTDRLIFVGDLINRGPDSLGVWLYYRELGASSVLGNHELHLIREAQGIDVKKPWIIGLKTEFGSHFDAFLKDIQSWPHFIETEDYLVVHGGLVPGEHPSQSDPVMVSCIRTWRDCAQGAAEGESRPWFDHYKGKKLVVFGHWAKMEGITRDNVIGLDTGCVYGKRLTALILPTREQVSVAAKSVYCKIQVDNRAE